MPKVNVIFDAGPQIGLGHQVRSRSIAEELVRSGCDVRLAALDSVTEDFFTECDVALFDAPVCLENQLQWAKQSQAVTFALDYFGAGPVEVGIFVYLHSPPQPSVQKVESGFEYVVLRPEIVGQTTKERDEGVLVMLGGADVLGQSGEVASRLSDQGESVTLVEGPLAEITAPPKVKKLKDPKDLTERMAAATWAVTNAGGSLFEMLYLGTPVFVLPQTRFEKTIAEELRAEPGVLGVGGPSDLVAPTLPPQSQPETSLIDGQGAQRICDLVLQHCQ